MKEDRELLCCLILPKEPHIPKNHIWGWHNLLPFRYPIGNRELLIFLSQNCFLDLMNDTTTHSVAWIKNPKSASFTLPFYLILLRLFLFAALLSPAPIHQPVLSAPLTVSPRWHTSLPAPGPQHTQLRSRPFSGLPAAPLISLQPAAHLSSQSDLCTTQAKTCYSPS